MFDCVCVCVCVYIPGLHNNNNNSNNYDNDDDDVDPCLKKLSSFPFISSHSYTHSLPPSLPHSLCLSPSVTINRFVVVVVVVDLSQLSCKSARVGMKGGDNMLGVLHVQRMLNAPNNNNVCCQFFFFVCEYCEYLQQQHKRGQGGRCDDTVITCSCAQRSGQVGSSSERNEQTTTTT